MLREFSNSTDSQCKSSIALVFICTIARNNQQDKQLLLYWSVQAKAEVSRKLPTWGQIEKLENQA